MNVSKELLKIRKKQDRLIGKCGKLEKKENKVKEKIKEKEKKKASKDRRLFIKNIQVSRVGTLLKRKWTGDEPDLVYATEMRDYAFSVEELLSQITVHLGPMEYFMFSRTSKQLSSLLLDSFAPSWSTQFLKRLEEETPFPIGLDLNKGGLKTALGSFQSIRKTLPNDDERFSLFQTLLGRLQSTFVSFRQHRTITFNTPENRGTLSVERWRRPDTLCFLYNNETSQVTRPVDHNVLFTSVNLKNVVGRVNRNFNRIHDFFIPEEELGISYCRYDDLNALDLRAPSKFKNPRDYKLPFFISREENEVVPYAKTNYTAYFLFLVPIRKSDQRFLCDEYECRCIIQSMREGKPRFNPVYANNESMKALLLKK